jgi:hypothetical protein
VWLGAELLHLERVFEGHVLVDFLFGGMGGVHADHPCPFQDYLFWHKIRRPLGGLLKRSNGSELC